MTHRLIGLILAAGTGLLLGGQLVIARSTTRTGIASIPGNSRHLV